MIDRLFFCIVRLPYAESGSQAGWMYIVFQRGTKLGPPLHGTAAAPMLEVKRAIKAGEAPCGNPHYAEEKPAYLSQRLLVNVDLA